MILKRLMACKMESQGLHESRLRAREMAQQVKVLAAQAHDPSSAFRVHTEKLLEEACICNPRIHRARWEADYRIGFMFIGQFSWNRQIRRRNYLRSK